MTKIVANIFDHSLTVLAKGELGNVVTTLD